jgi:hypothetical protein
MALGRRGFLQGVAAAAATGLMGVKRSTADLRAVAGPGIVPDADAAKAIILLYFPGGLDAATSFNCFPGVTLGGRNPSAGAYTTLPSGLCVNNRALGGLTAHASKLTVFRSAASKAPALGNHDEVARYSLFRRLTSNELRGDPGAQNVLNHLTSGLLDREPERAPLNLVDFRPFDDTWDFIGENNHSRNPAAAAQYLPQQKGSFVDSLAPGSQSAALRERINGRLVSRVDRFFARRTQPHLAGAMAASAQGLRGVTGLDPAPLWPPDGGVLSTLRQNLTNHTYAEQLQLDTADSLALAYELLKQGHLPAYTIMGPASWFWDCHMPASAIGDTPYVSTEAFTSAMLNPVAGFISLLESTPSPLSPGKMLSDDTVIVLMSEMGHDPSPGQGPDTGWEHAANMVAVTYGGPFARGKVLGRAPELEPEPIDYETGLAGSDGVPGHDVIWNTVAAACNVDLPYPDAGVVTGALDV